MKLREHLITSTQKDLVQDTYIKIFKSQWQRKKILKATREKWMVTYKGIPITLSVDVSEETLKARKEWIDSLKILKNKKSHQEYSIWQVIIQI